MKKDVAINTAIRSYDSWLKFQFEYNQLPSLAAVVVDGEDVIFSQAYGYASIENKVRAESRTGYRLGSISKVFTAIAIMQLKESGLLDLDDKVLKYLPW